MGGMTLEQALGVSNSTIVSNGNNMVKSDFYLKVGIPCLNQETDEVEFVSLPQPLYLDTMKKSSVSGEGQFQDLLLKGNDLLDQILAEAKIHLQPGETKELNLKVVLCRRKTSQEAKHVKMSFNIF